MKSGFFLLTAIVTLSVLSACGKSTLPTPVPSPGTDQIPDPAILGNTIFFTSVDRTSVIRNPCTGWSLYDDATGDPVNAAKFWSLQDPYVKYASIYYLRWRWADMEPEEGKYAWIYDENYKAIIQGAWDRGLKVAFRVFDDSYDNKYAGTPEFVRQAGAEGRVAGRFWTPYEDDPVFKQKMENFVRAFAAQYNDPSKVDFVDGVNLGSWGECHHLVLKDESQNNKTAVLEWITDLYSKYFTKVPLIMPVNSEFGHDNELRIARDRHNYGFRRDGLGSMWFYPDEKARVKPLYPSTLLIGEACYSGGNETDDIHWILETETYYDFTGWGDIYEATFNDAIDYHFNVLDLRTPIESKRWVTRFPTLVQKFIEIGGYRLYPDEVSVPEKMESGKSYTVSHRWVNLAGGIFPNNIHGWNYKYKVAFALLDINGSVKKMFIDTQAEPHDFVQDKPQSYKFQIALNGVDPGNYSFAVAIIDTTADNKPGIKLATRNDHIKDWTKIADVKVE